MKVRVAFKEVSYGSAILEVPDNATEAEIYELADRAYSNGYVDWHGGDYEATEYEVQD